MEDYQKVSDDALGEIQAANTLEDLASTQVAYLGKNGIITQGLKSLAALDQTEKKKQGKLINDHKVIIHKALAEKKKHLSDLALEKSLLEESIDISLPEQPYDKGSYHPLRLVEKRLHHILVSLGFDLVDGPEIEDDYHNFEALNFPPNHPARDMQDTLFIDDIHLLRTHTSSVQIRALKTKKPPLAIVSSGRVFRSDSLDATHSPVFHQLEGLKLNQNASFSDLKSMIITLLSEFFGYDVKLRFRPSFFPFTEPSAEVDLYFQGHWLEVMGCGMVHPSVIDKAGLDSKQTQGFAFGLGLERLAMMCYDLGDIRDFYRNDKRLLEQFFAPVRYVDEVKS